MLETKPIQTFRGTMEEVLSHKGEIPPGAMLELRVYQSANHAIEDNEFAGKTFGDLFGDLIGTIDAGPADVARNPNKYMQGFGEASQRRMP